MNLQCLFDFQHIKVKDQKRFSDFPINITFSGPPCTILFTCTAALHTLYNFIYMHCCTSHPVQFYFHALLHLPPCTILFTCTAALPTLYNFIYMHWCTSHPVQFYLHALLHLPPCTIFFTCTAAPPTLYLEYVILCPYPFNASIIHYNKDI